MKHMHFSAAMLPLYILVATVLCLPYTARAQGSIGIVGENSSSGIGQTGSLVLPACSAGDIIILSCALSAGTPVPANLGTGYTNWVKSGTFFYCVSSVQQPTEPVTISITEGSMAQPWAAYVTTWSGSTGVVYSNCLFPDPGDPFPAGTIAPPFQTYTTTFVVPQNAYIFASWGGTYGANYSLTYSTPLTGGPSRLDTLLIWTQGSDFTTGVCGPFTEGNVTFTFAGSDNPSGSCWIMYILPAAP